MVSKLNCAEADMKETQENHKKTFESTEMTLRFEINSENLHRRCSKFSL